MATHTPGPWDYRPLPFDDWGCVRARDGGVIVARAAGAASEQEQAEHRAAGTDPYQANGRLIAAAPNLLAVAREFIAMYDGLRESICDTVRQRLERADAAIAKAEGR